MNGVSVLILTLNEEDNLPRCLASLGWCDDVVVLDSLSTDQTREIAESHGARVVTRAFDNYANQRNFGLKEIPYSHPWLLMVDADEEISIELINEIHEVLRKEKDDVCLYRIRRKDHFMGRWIRRSSGYPTWFGRLMRVGRVWVERDINEEYHTDGQTGYLQGHFYHYPFNKGFHAWLEKHNRYSTMEGRLLAEKRRERIRWADFFGSDPALRRKALKALVYRMPCRPVAVFLALYLLRGGILDGRAGFTFCVLRSFYEYMIDLKAAEAKLRAKGLPL